MQKRDIPVLAYRREDSITPEALEEHFRYLYSHDFKAITLDELSLLEDGKDYGSCVVITFDDGYGFMDVLDLLVKYDLKAALFLVTDYVGKDHYPSWEQISKFPPIISIQSNGKTGRSLKNISEEVDEELNGSKKAIKEQAGKLAAYFLYPLGYYSPAIEKKVLSCYKSALTNDQTFLKEPGMIGRLFAPKALQKFREMLSRPTLSVTILTKNSEKTLEAALKSIAGIADEIVVVDNGSTDNTLSIAKKFKAKIIKNAWVDDFSQARNVALKNSSMEWIFCLDSDETIAELDIIGLLELMSKREFDAYIFPTRNYTPDASITGYRPNRKEYNEEQGSGYIISKKVRLFKNRGFEFRGKVHELVESSIQEKKGKIALTDIPIHNSGTMELKEKKEFYYALGEKKLKESPNDPKALYEFGIECKNLGLHEKASECLEKAYSIAPNKLIAIELANVKKSMNDVDGAIGILSELSKMEDFNVHFILGLCYLKKKNLEEAKSEFLKANKIEPSNPRALSNLGIAYNALEDYKNAINSFLKALQIDSSNPKTFLNLGISYEKIGSLNEAIKAYSAAAGLGHEKKNEILAKIIELKQLQTMPSSVDYTVGVK